MAHFAQVNEENVVTAVVVVPDEQEHRREEFLKDDLGLGGRWVQTSYNHRIRGTYAGIGFTYDAEKDIFVPPIEPDIDLEQITTKVMQHLMQPHATSEPNQ
jgi:hypothetical protein